MALLISEELLIRLIVFGWHSFLDFADYVVVLLYVCIGCMPNVHNYDKYALY